MAQCFQGKGNRGRFIDRGSKIVAAGKPSAQYEPDISELLSQYTLQDNVDSLLGDAILPTSSKPPDEPQKQYKKPTHIDYRHDAVGEVGNLLRTEPTTKPEILTREIKETTYSSYWRKPLGMAPSPSTGLPAGYDYKNTTFGRKTVGGERLYDLVLPKIPLVPGMSPSFDVGYQKTRKYCKDSFDPNKCYGKIKKAMLEGCLMKQCLTDDNILIGKDKTVIVSIGKANEIVTSKPRDGKVLEPINNIKFVPEGYRFGKTDPDYSPIFLDRIANCEVNLQRYVYFDSLANLNKLRSYLGSHAPSFFHKVYLDLKYLDKDKSGWIPKETLIKGFYDNSVLISIDAAVPLLVLLGMSDGENVNYESVISILDKRNAIELPRMCDVDPDFQKYTTTYGDMAIQPEEQPLRIGIPSGRYFDRDFPKNFNLPDETDVKCCLDLSIMHEMGLNHRDLYEKREPDIIKQVFSKAGYSFTDDEFIKLWEEAKKLHSKGWVCYETFKRVIEKAHPIK